MATHVPLSKQYLYTTALDLTTLSYNCRTCVTYLCLTTLTVMGPNSNIELVRINDTLTTLLTKGVAN